MIYVLLLVIYVSHTLLPWHVIIGSQQDIKSAIEAP